MSAETPTPRGRLFVLSGPSGVGKDAVLSLMKEMDGLNCRFATTATTRPIRRGERDGADYIFLTEAQFRALIESDGLLEWAEVYGNLYGVPKREVSEALARGENVLVKIDVQGAATVRRLYPDAVLIFLDPPDADALERRLRTRATESEAGPATQARRRPRRAARSGAVRPPRNQRRRRAAKGGGVGGGYYTREERGVRNEGCAGILAALISPRHSRESGNPDGCSQVRHPKSSTN